MYGFGFVKMHFCVVYRSSLHAFYFLYFETKLIRSAGMVEFKKHFDIYSSKEVLHQLIFFSF